MEANANATAQAPYFQACLVFMTLVYAFETYLDLRCVLCLATFSLFLSLSLSLSLSHRVEKAGSDENAVVAASTAS